MTRSRCFCIILLFALFTGYVYGNNTSAPINCSLTASPRQVRIEGTHELMGDMVLTCVGGPPTPAGQPIALSNFRIALGAPITSRVVNPLTAASEALLLVDEPFPSNPFPSGATQVIGSPTGQNLCLASGGTKCQILGVAPGVTVLSRTRVNTTCSRVFPQSKAAFRMWISLAFPSIRRETTRSG